MSRKKLLCAISPSKKRCQTRFLSGIGMKGTVTLDGYLHKAERIVTLIPYFGSEAVILESISQKLHEKDYSFTLFPCPVTLQPEAIYFEEERLLLRCGKAVNSPKEKVIDCKKKIERPSASEKTMLRTLARQENDCLASAGFFFEKMKEQHFALEKIYGDAMDFPALEQFKKETIRRILS